MQKIPVTKAIRCQRIKSNLLRLFTSPWDLSLSASEVSSVSNPDPSPFVLKGIKTLPASTPLYLYLLPLGEPPPPSLARRQAPSSHFRVRSVTSFGESSLFPQVIPHILPLISLLQLDPWGQAGTLFLLSPAFSLVSTRCLMRVRCLSSRKYNRVIKCLCSACTQI